MTCSLQNLAQRDIITVLRTSLLYSETDLWCKHDCVSGKTSRTITSVDWDLRLRRHTNIVKNVNISKMETIKIHKYTCVRIYTKHKLIQLENLIAREPVALNKKKKMGKGEASSRCCNKARVWRTKLRFIRFV